MPQSVNLWSVASKLLSKITIGWLITLNVENVPYIAPYIAPLSFPEFCFFLFSSSGINSHIFFNSTLNRFLEWCSPPISRFSRTVISSNTRLPCGTKPMPILYVGPGSTIDDRHVGGLHFCQFCNHATTISSVKNGDLAPMFSYPNVLFLQTLPSCFAWRAIRRTGRFVKRKDLTPAPTVEPSPVPCKFEQELALMAPVGYLSH